jgi:hypothetical protein
MSISIYNYNKQENTFIENKSIANTLLSQINLANSINSSSSSKLKIVEYVIKKQKQNKSNSSENNDNAKSSKFKLTTLNNLARKRQKTTRLRKKTSTKMIKHSMHHNQNRYNNNNNNNNNKQQQHHNQHQHQMHQYMQPQQHSHLSSYQNYFSSNNQAIMNQQQQQNLFQFNQNFPLTSASHPFQSNTISNNNNNNNNNGFRRISFNNKSLKSKSIKINRATPANASKFSFQPTLPSTTNTTTTTTTTSVPVSSNLSSNSNFTSLMSASFGVNPGVAAAAAAACATLAQLLRSELTINLAKDQPRLVISGSRPTTTATTATQPQNINNNNYLNCNRRSNFKSFFRKSPYYNFPPYYYNHHKIDNANTNSLSSIQFNNNSNNKSKVSSVGAHRFKHFKSGNFNTSLASAAPSLPNTTVNTPSVSINLKQSMPQPIIIGGGKNKTAPYNTTQYIMHDYSKRRSFKKDQVCPSDDFSDDWNNALKAAALEAATDATLTTAAAHASAVDSTTTTTPSNTFNFNFLNIKSSKLAVENGDSLCFSTSVDHPSSTTNDESNLAEIGRKLSRSFSNLCTASSSSSNINCIEMKEDGDNETNEHSEENVSESNSIAQFSCSV